MDAPELIEDYCIRAGRVHPWASQAGHEIKALKTELVQLREQSAAFGISTGESSTPCARCGGTVIEFSLPSDVWNAVVRQGGPERDDEYLCYACWLAALRAFVEQLARDREAWDAVRSGKIISVGPNGAHDPDDYFVCHRDISGRHITLLFADPVNAVLAVVNAAKQDTADGTPRGHGDGFLSTEDRPQ